MPWYHRLVILSEQQNPCGASETRAHEPAILSAWRRLTGGSSVQDSHRRTLIACSGGADSVSLTLTLASSEPGAITVAHIIHDLRPREETEADAELVRQLAADLGVPCVSAEVRVPREGNTESLARQARYQSLETLARETGCAFLATGHHAADQWETVLMRLARGAGPASLAGMRESRPLGDLTLIRPMLGLTHEQAVAICRHHNRPWAEDRTNHDGSNLRGRMRASAEFGPGRLNASLELLADAAGLIDDLASKILDRAQCSPSRVELDLADLAGQRRVVVGQVLRRAAVLVGGEAGMDRIGQRTLDEAREMINRAENGWNREAGCVGFAIEGGRLVVTARGPSQEKDRDV